MMRRPRRLKRWMKEMLREKGLNPNNWHYIKSPQGELKILHKQTGTMMTIKLDA